MKEKRSLQGLSKTSPKEGEFLGEKQEEDGGREMGRTETFKPGAQARGETNIGLSDRIMGMESATCELMGTCDHESYRGQLGRCSHSKSWPPEAVPLEHCRHCVSLTLGQSKTFLIGHDTHSDWSVSGHTSQ